MNLIISFDTSVAMTAEWQVHKYFVNMLEKIQSELSIQTHNVWLACRINYISYEKNPKSVVL